MWAATARRRGGLHLAGRAGKTAREADPGLWAVAHGGAGELGSLGFWPALAAWVGGLAFGVGAHAYYVGWRRERFWAEQGLGRRVPTLVPLSYALLGVKYRTRREDFFDNEEEEEAEE